MGFEKADIHQVKVLSGEREENDSQSEVLRYYYQFILEFSINNQFIYRVQLRENLLVKKYYLKVHCDHIIQYNEELYKKLFEDPSNIVPLFEQAITNVAKRILYVSVNEVPTTFPSCQLLLECESRVTPIRELASENVSKIVRVRGIIISATFLSLKITDAMLICRTCKHTIKIKVKSGFGQVSLPKKCQGSHNFDNSSSKERCPSDPYIIYHDKSLFIDQQVLKIQELPDMVPVGEIPRQIMLQAERYLTDIIVPGNKVTIVGIFSIYQSKQSSKNLGKLAIRNPYLRVMGIETDMRNVLYDSLVYYNEEEEELLKLSKKPDLFELFSRSIAPSIYGNTDIKKAITSLLFGGSKKILPDGMRLRGDINVLLLGDPGTAKSQLLKFVEKVSPISIFTSGKGSSAAGLTASVQRDPQTRDFYLEGGAMVLADQGVVCIDEFDKMRDEDRVAIHEAMEQQTISIAKAGITTVLNSRTSVLGAANSVFGRYDNLKSPGENIDFQTTILSRFDMIFVIKDNHNRNQDISIAHHVMNIHTSGNNQNQNQNQIESEIPIQTMKKYIQYAKLKCEPRLLPEAAEKLSSHFVSIRRKLHASEAEMNERSTIPITVRQLEAIIRIAESLAKIRLSPFATEDDVEEAIRLFTASTINAIDQGVSCGGIIDSKLQNEIKKVEVELKRRLPIGWSTSYNTLKKEIVDTGKATLAALDKTLNILEKFEVIKFRHQRQNILRCGA